MIRFFTSFVFISCSLMAIAQVQLDPSQNPPNGLHPEDVPQFIVLGWDDNERILSMRWSIDFVRDLINPAGLGISSTYDGTPVRFSYYNTATYIDTQGADSPDDLKLTWNQAYLDGHEMGNHTHSHAPTLKTLDEAGWTTEITKCNDLMALPVPEPPDWWTNTVGKGAGIAPEDIVGFRTPFLAYGGPVFPVLKANGFLYDCSIEEGNQWEQDGTNFFWPYTLDNASLSGHYASWLGNPDNEDHFDIPDVPGLWELPNHVVIIPDDSTCTEKGYPTGMRTKIAAKYDWFESKFTGFDYNLWVQADFSKEEFLAVLKHNLDLRYDNNRCPFMFGTHTGVYNSTYNYNCTGANSELDRRWAIEEFITYALTKSDVRIVPGKDIIEWMKNPIPLSGSVSITENSNRSLNIYPNPANDYVNIMLDNWTGESISLEVTNMNGQTVLEKEINSTLEKMDVSSLNQGIYFMKVISNNNSELKKLVIK